MCSELTPRAHIPDTRIPQLMQPWQGGQAAESDLTGGEVAAIRLCLLGFGSLCATLATGLFTLALSKIQKLKIRTNKSSPSSILTSGLFDIVPFETGDRELPVWIRKRCPCTWFWSFGLFGFALCLIEHRNMFTKGQQILLARRTPFCEFNILSRENFLLRHCYFFAFQHFYVSQTVQILQENSNKKT